MPEERQRIPCHVTLDSELVAQLRVEAKKGNEKNFSRVVEEFLRAGLESRKTAAEREADVEKLLDEMRAAQQAMREGRILHRETLPNGEGRMLIGTSASVNAEIGDHSPLATLSVNGK